MQKLQNYIAGQFCDPMSNGWLSVENPAVGQIYGKCPNSDVLDVDKAVESAWDALPRWRSLDAATRSRYLTKIADILEQQLEEFALAESQDQGKPLALARTMDIPRAIENFRFFAGQAIHTQSQAYRTNENVIHYTDRSPLGVVALISPWNLPLYLLSWKIAPAIAFGNTAVCKPSELTPLTAFKLCHVLDQAGLPAGVVNMVFGSGSTAGQPLVAHKRIRAVSFTGGTKTGAQIAATAAPQFKKLSLELGGKNPNIIFADANLELAVQTTVRSSFLNQGEICLCGSRIYVEKSIYDQFIAAFIEKTNRFKVGDPLSPDTQMGALVSSSHLDKVDSYVKAAIADGGRALIGGERLTLADRCAGGHFYPPTILVDVPHSSRAIQEEIFGPVVTVTAFENEVEVVELANELDYGLSASVWTESLSRAHRVAKNIDAGIVWINGWLMRDLRTPFGGVKASGVGREGGAWSYDFFTECKDICIHTRNTDTGASQ